MEDKNYKSYPTVVILLVVIILIALSQLQAFHIIDIPLKKSIDVLADVRKSDKVQTNGSNPEKQNNGLAGTNNPSEKLPEENIETFKGIINYGVNIDNGNGFTHFLNALLELKEHKRKVVRIAYFGDSMIEGDLISKDLRDSLQSYFGGGGVGFVSITSVVSSFRNTVTHTYSTNWNDNHFKVSGVDFSKLGIAGHVFNGPDAAWVKYSPVNNNPHLDHFQQAKLYYGPNASGNVDVNGISYPLAGDKLVNELNIPISDFHSSLMLTMHGNANLYGVGLDDSAGIVVDNYSFRGTSGLELGKLNPEVLKEFQEERHYDLVIFQYGPNVLFKPELTNFSSWFANPMAKVWTNLKSAFTDASFLVVGTADKSYRSGGSWITAPGVNALLAVQDSMARVNGFAFWSLYANMGGSGSMTKWVEQNPPLANKDYTHLNFKGANIVGGMLYHAIISDYKKYVQKDKATVAMH